VYAAPVVWAAADRTRVYAGSSDRVLYALDAASGERLWSHEVETWRPTIGGARLSAPCLGIAAGRDAVFVGHWVWDRSLAANMQKAGVTALDAKTGEVLWTRELGDNELTAPLFAIAGAKKLLFVGSTSGTLHALDAETGAPLWKRAELDAIRSPPAFRESPQGPRLYTASKYGALRALDAVTGQELWSYKTGDRIVGSPAVASVRGRELVLVGSFDRSLHAVDATTGAPVWRRATRGAVYSSPAVFDDGKRVIAVASAWDHRVHAFDAADGTLLWSAYTGQPLWDAVALDESTGASPVAARVNGRWMVYAGSWDGTLYALPVAEMDPTGGSAGRSNLAFGGSLAVAAVIAGLAALLLTRRARRGV
jgi:outer membrane protein assembly factor BamB